MDLRECSLTRFMKEKRERQPNWTEHEKQLLISLTRSHQAVLENKCSDSMTLQRKSNAWNEIMLRMNAAGYNRSKERLKQQLGRIRAAEAKKLREALENTSPTEGNCKNNLNVYNCLKLHVKAGDNATVTSSQSPGNEAFNVNAEMRVSNDNGSYSDEFLSQLPSLKNDKSGTRAILQHNVMTLMLQNIQSKSETANISVNNGDITDQVSTDKDNLNEDLPDANNGNILGKDEPKKDINKRDDNLRDATPKFLQKKNRFARTMRLKASQISPRKEQLFRQLHMYRVAVEQERLRALKIQQRRDRILYRKDLEIQNLKLEILRNITNQMQDGNCVNLE